MDSETKVLDPANITPLLTHDVLTSEKQLLDQLVLVIEKLGVEEKDG